MEFLAIIFGIGYLFLPIIAIVMVIGSKSTISELRMRLERQEKLLALLQKQIGERLSKVEHVQEEQQKLLFSRNTERSAEQGHLDNRAAAPKSTPAPTVATTTAPASDPLAALDQVSMPAVEERSPVSTPAPMASSIDLTDQATSAVVLPVPTPSPSAENLPALELLSDATATAMQNAQPVPTETLAATTSAATSATSKPAPAPATAPKSRPAAPPPATTAWLNTAREWLFGGNLVAKMGLLILFFGVAFLLKYASERISTPIEVRFGLIALADSAFLLWGWRIRNCRPGISLPVQGAAMAIMMLTTFGAMRIYHVIPSELAFFLLFALTALTCLLAVLQNAMWLALFGITGGFIVPIATSTGGGSHIGLFSYYLLLNFGILGIALKRAWRPLNLVGMFFTFLIGTAWGVLRYEPQFYASTQAFLLVFFLLYVAITVLYGQRQAPNLRGLVDGTLTFGTPMMAFGLQYGLVQHDQFGLAYSALALGVFYCGLASLLWRKTSAQPASRLQVEAFLALGVVFATLTIPLALDGRWTSAAWALEGAGIVWLGLRQQRRLTWAFGLLVQVGAWFSFIFNVSGLDSAKMQAQNLWLGFLSWQAQALCWRISSAKSMTKKQVKTATPSAVSHCWRCFCSLSQRSG